MENRAHNEPKEQRLKRFQNGPPVEIIETLLNSIDNYFNNEISLTIDERNYQTSLLFLGIHAVALTISESFFDKKGEEGYRLFLEKFVDGNTEDKKFSKIADEIHNWRNVLAHQWLASSGHKIGYDYKMSLGWEKRNGVTFINPKIYCNQYLSAFRDGNRKIWNYKDFLNDSELENVKNRLINKYLKG